MKFIVADDAEAISVCFNWTNVGLKWVLIMAGLNFGSSFNWTNVGLK